jgi:hypothetical protein
MIEMAKQLAVQIVDRGLKLIYGGGNVGLMGVIATEVLAQGGEVIGIIPEFLIHREGGDLELTEQYVVKSMHERKALMVDKTDYIMAIPGGFGTLDELFEMLTWLQLGLHRKPIGLLNFDGFYDHLLLQLQHMVAKGLLRPDNYSLITQATNTHELLDKLLATEHPVNDFWFRDRNLS